MPGEREGRYVVRENDPLRVLAKPSDPSSPSLPSGELREALDAAYDKLVEHWHETVNDEPALHEWMGLSREACARWVERPYSSRLEVRSLPPLVEPCPGCGGTGEQAVHPGDEFIACSSCSSRGWVVREVAVEVAAEALWYANGRTKPNTYPYERLAEVTKEDLRPLARAALEAVAAMEASSEV